MRKRIIFLAIALSTILSIFSPVFLLDTFAIKCPEGTKRAKEEVGDITECNLDKSSGQTSIPTGIRNAINVSIGILSFLAIVIIIVSGFKLTTSQGDATKVAQARRAILFSVVGLVIALLSFVIVNLVVGKIS